MTISTRGVRLSASALCALAAVLLATLATLATAAAAAAAGSGPKWTGALTRQALASGYLTRLPPTVSVALGLANAKEGTDVRQLITKSGHQVRTFNVSVAKNSDLVLFTVDAQSGATAAYLIGPDAQLRKAVSYQAGAEAKDMPAADARAGLAREARFWSGRARRAMPAPAAPAAQ
jgi:hypothetical protein